MKQTAVEFLIEEIKPFLSMPIEDAYKTILQAKQIEREQMATNCNQLEISDEEIEELTIKKYYELQKKRRTLHHWSWVNGMKMYREQLKQK